MTVWRCRWRRLLYLILAGITLCGGGGCSATDPGGGKALRGDDSPTSRFTGVDLVTQDPDGTRWRLQAEQGEGWEGVGTGKLQWVRGSLERGSASVRLEAGRAEVDEMDAVRLSGGVILRWDGYTARVPQAEYRRRDGRVTSGEAVELEGSTVSVQGTGLDLDVERRMARIQTGVTARIAGASP